MLTMIRARNHSKYFIFVSNKINYKIGRFNSQKIKIEQLASKRESTPAKKKRFR